MTENRIKETYERIQLPPGAMDRIQRQIEAELDMPMSQKRVVLQPRKKRWLPIMAAAAALALLVLGIMSLRSERSQQGTDSFLIPAAQPGEMENAVIISPSPEPDQSFIDDLYYRALYAKTLQLYRSVVEDRLDADACRDLGISELCGKCSDTDAACTLGYTLEDLNGDGVPELLIGFAEGEELGSECLLDLYQLSGTQPVLIAQSGEDVCWYDCGGGMLKRERGSDQNEDWSIFRMQDDPLREGIMPKAVWMLSAFSQEDKEAFVWLQSLDSEEQIEEITYSQGQEWLELNFSTVSHSFIPFEEQESGQTHEQERTDLTNQQTRELQLLLNEMSKQEETFAQTDYADREPGGVVKLLDKIGQYAERYGLSQDQRKALLLGRENLDGAEAEAYAALMGKLYGLNPRGFLEAWHESGEPDLLMQEVTLCDKRKDSAAWLQERWRFAQAAEERGFDANEILTLIRRTEDQTAELDRQIAASGVYSEEEKLALSQQRCQLWDLCLDQVLSMLEPGLTEDELEWLQYNQSEWTKRMGWSIDKNTKDLEGDALLRATYDSRSDLVRKRVYEITQFFPSYVVLY